MIWKGITSMGRNKRISTWFLLGFVCVLIVVLSYGRAENRDDLREAEKQIVESSSTAVEAPVSEPDLSEVYEAEVDTQEEELKNLSYDEAFEVIRGRWEVGEYLDTAVEYHGVEQDDPEYQEASKRNKEYVLQEYSGKVLEIEEENIVNFQGGSDDVFLYETYDELFGLVRNPVNIAPEPPFYIASIRLKGSEDWMMIIKSNDDAFLLTVRGHFFKLNKVE